MTSTLHRLACVVILGGMATGCAQRAPVQSFAMVPERIEPGQAVRVHATDGRALRGPVLEVTAESITLSGANAGAPIPAGSITRIEQHGDPVWNGLAIGVGAGTLVALLAGRDEVPCPDEDATNVCYDAKISSRLAGVAVGGAIGAAIDGLLRSRRPLYIAPGNGAMNLVIAPVATPKSAGVLISISF